MKKVLFLIALALGCTSAFAQKLDKAEARQLKNFLTQTAEKDGTNANALKVVNINDVSAIEGVTIENGHVTAIEWKDKHLAGDLDLSGFKALKKVDVSRNKIASVDVSDDPVLTDFNASRNVLTSVSLANCPTLSKVSVYKNRLTDLSLETAPMIENLNVSNNLFVELNVSNSTTLKTLNCQGCHLETLLVSGCTSLKNLYCGYNKLTSLDRKSVV